MNSKQKALDKKKEHYKKSSHSFSEYGGKTNKVSPRHEKRFLKGVRRGMFEDLNPVTGVKDIVAMAKGRASHKESKNEKRFHHAKA